MRVQLLEEVPQQNLGGQKTWKIRRYFGQLSNLITNISGTRPENENLKIALSTQVHLLPYWAEKKFRERWSTNKKVIGVNLHPLKWTFYIELYFSRKGVLPPKIFTHITTHKIVFPIGFEAPGGLKLGLRDHYLSALYNASTQIWGAKNVQFYITSGFDRQYLRNKTRYYKSERCVTENDSSCEISQVNSGPLSIK